MIELENLDRITEGGIGDAIEAHRALGAGLLGGCSKFFYYTPREFVYEACLAFELVSGFSAFSVGSAVNKY